MKFHESKTGELIALRAHQAHATAAFISALASLAMFGLSVAGYVWHKKGQQDHQDALDAMK